MLKFLLNWFSNLRSFMFRSQGIHMYYLPPKRNLPIPKPAVLEMSIEPFYLLKGHPSHLSPSQRRHTRNAFNSTLPSSFPSQRKSSLKCFHESTFLQKAWGFLHGSRCRHKSLAISSLRVYAEKSQHSRLETAILRKTCSQGWLALGWCLGTWISGVLSPFPNSYKSGSCCLICLCLQCGLCGTPALLLGVWNFGRGGGCLCDQSPIKSSGTESLMSFPGR